MKDQFVTYEIAKEFKRIGFNEPCLGEFYIGAPQGEEGSPEKPSFNICPDILDENPVYNNNGYKTYIAAPLWQQAIDWLKEEHGIHVEPFTHCFNANLKNKPKTDWCIKRFVSKNLFIDAYEQTREAAILKAQELVKVAA